MNSTNIYNVVIIQGKQKWNKNNGNKDASPSNY